MEELSGREATCFYIDWMMLFLLIFEILKNARSLTLWLNGRWFSQIVDRDSGNLYSISAPFPCSDFVSPPQGFGGGGGQNKIIKHNFWGWGSLCKKFKNPILYLLRVLCYFQKNYKTKFFGEGGVILLKIYKISFHVFFVFPTFWNQPPPPPQEGPK